MKKIIALVGETGSGKDTVSKYLQEKYRPVFYLRFSDPLTETLKIFFDEIKKEDQQWLASLLRQRFGQNILGEAIAQKIKGIQKGIIILDGVRAWAEFEMIKKWGGKIIYVTADAKTRWQRIQNRGEKKDDKVSYKKFLEMEKAETEIFIKEIGQKADYCLDNSDSKEDLYGQIDKLLESYDKKSLFRKIHCF